MIKKGTNMNLKSKAAVMIILSVGLFCLFLTHVFADEIVLQSGQELKGEVVEKIDEAVKIQLTTGMVLTYKVSDIKTINDQSVSEFEIIKPEPPVDVIEAPPIEKETKQEIQTPKVKEAKKKSKTIESKEKKSEAVEKKQKKDEVKSVSCELGERYHNNRKGFSIQFPAGWEKVKMAGAQVAMVSPEYKAGIMVLFRKMPEFDWSTLGEEFNDIDNDYEGVVKLYKSLPEIRRKHGMIDSKLQVDNTSEIKVDNIDAFRVVCRYSSAKKGIMYMFERGDVLWFVESTASKKDFPKYKDLFDEVMKSFRFKKSLIEKIKDKVGGGKGQ